jgi:hypothetical protein
MAHHPPHEWNNQAAVADLLAGRPVLGVLAGHAHRDMLGTWEGYPMIQTGALSGEWWLGPNLDGTPQGFRLLEISRDGLETQYVELVSAEE